MLIALPRQAFIIGGDEFKGQTLAGVLIFGAFIAMVVAPLFGALSDRIYVALGRRKFWIILGSCFSRSSLRCAYS
jgi:MFS family permease